MASLQSDQLSQIEATCGSLLSELQIIWDELGEPDVERDRMLLELEQECLEIYRKKVDYANRSRAQLRQTIADCEAELAVLCSTLGERPVHICQYAGSLKEELNTIAPQLEEMRKSKTERKNQFLEVLEQIQKTSAEIGNSEYCPPEVVLDEFDLSIHRLDVLNRQLQSLQKEKADRLKLVMEHMATLNSLCAVLGSDFKQTVCEVHPSLDKTQGPENVNNHTIERLESAIEKMRAVKIERMQKLQDLTSSMFQMWSLMDTPIEEQQKYQHITCNIAASEHERTEPNSLSEEFIKYVEEEVLKIEVLKASKMKELVLKKKLELAELRRKTHLIEEEEEDFEREIDAIENGSVDPSLILEQIEVQISVVKEETFSRKAILEKAEKWLAAREEESWLEDYNMDENRYNAGRGTHLMLKRAEKARTVVSKIPAIVEALISKTNEWEEERGIEFSYDGVSLLSMLDDYNILKEEKEQERKRHRDQKRLQGQIIVEQEVLFGSKQSPSKTPTSKKIQRNLTMGPDNLSEKQLQGIYGNSRELVESANKITSKKSAEYTVVSDISSRIQTATEVAACTYEYNTSWGRQIGWTYGSLVEDILTGLEIQAKGWKSVFLTPNQPAFLGSAPMGGPTSLTQYKRWATGLTEVNAN